MASGAREAAGRGVARARGAPRWIEPAALALFFAALAGWSWGKWTDVHIDFGNELYVAWQIASGKELYHDMAHRQGPLSPYLNALWFSLFGVSLRTLVIANLLVLVAIAAMSWRIFERACGRVAGLATVAVLLGVFAFSQYTPIANYNYVTPYHHHQTHAVALSLAMLLLLAGPVGRTGSGGGRLALAGACLGGVFLTKAELFVPAAAAAAVGVALGAAGGTRRLRALVFAASALAPVMLAFVALATRMPAATALRGTLGNWTTLGAALGDPFYLIGAGFDAPGGNLIRALSMLVALAGFVALSLALERLVPRRHRAFWAVGAGAAVFLVLATLPGPAFWLDLPRVLPVATLLALAWLLAAGDGAVSRPGARALLMMWSVWALLLLAKLGLHPRIHHYGFVLAMPATLLAVAVLVSELPRAVAERWGGGELARACGITGVAALLVGFLGISGHAYARKRVPVGKGGDRILVEAPPASARGVMMAAALERLEAQMGADDTLLVLPEGIILNYWLRKPNPSRFQLFLPTELAAFGAERVLSDVRASEPDFIALVHRRAGEFGVGPFGEDPRNGRALLDWVQRHYERIDRIGGEPFGDQGFGIVLLRRSEAPEAATRR